MRCSIRAAARVSAFGLLLAVAISQAASAVPAYADTTQAQATWVKARVDALTRKRGLPGVRKAAARRKALVRSAAQVGLFKQGSGSVVKLTTVAAPGPGDVPDYFGLTPNWQWTPPIRKFVDTLPGLGQLNANNLGNFIPVAKPDTISFPGCDYYEIEVRQYTQKMHSDLPPTTLRGYVQVNKGTDSAGHNTLAPDPIHYLGPLINARKNRPVRVKFTNKLPTGQGGDLFLPVDPTVMGAGFGPDMMTNYAQNRSTIHLHGGKTVWISDGTPHQWTTPADEVTPWPKGVSVKPVSDMVDPGDGSMTFFYSNQQSARMLWFHDHVYGLTRLNVYAGEAAGYMITDDTEQRLISQGVIPSDQIPLIIQDKSWVDSDTIAQTDPTWNSGTTAPKPNTGDLWFPHVYMPNQNPYDAAGANAMGRWDYGLWFWPATTDITHGTVPNPYYDPINAPWEPPEMPGVPNNSATMEAFMDTPMVNGAPYPTLTLQPKAYRFRILNAANDRVWNLQLYQADPTVWTDDGRSFTEVKMVPAAPTAGFPALWPVDGRPGGVPDPAMMGPDFVQIGTESGFLAAPAVIKNQPVDWNLNMKNFTFGNVSSKALCLAPAERADVIVDFSRYAGRTLILYNDAPAGFPANDPRNDYFTNMPDNTDTGGHAPTLAGYGPNTRTVMQIRIAGKPQPAFNVAKLKAAWASTPTTPGVFAESQEPIIVAQPAYDSAYATSFPTVWPVGGWANINDTSMTIYTVAGKTLNLPFQGKGMHDEMGGSYDDYGRMAGKLGLSVPGGTAITQGFIKQGYIDPSTEVLNDSMVPVGPVAGDGTQLWKITHNGVDTHPVHFHLFDVQLIDRVGWDGAVDMPDPNELGWKDTVRVNPLQDTIVALRPTSAKVPFGVPDSIRLLDPTMPEGSDMGFSNVDTQTGNLLPDKQLNVFANFGWEYMWHCHILSHEEMEMMRPITFNVASEVPTVPQVAVSGTLGSPLTVTWTDGTPPSLASTWGNPKNEIGFKVQRATVSTSGAVISDYSNVATAVANVVSWQDTNAPDPGSAMYSYRVCAYSQAGESTSAPFRVGSPNAAATYTVTGWASSSGSIAPSGPQAVNSGDNSPAFAIAADPNFAIADVMVDGVSVGTTTSVTLSGVANDHAVWAFFAPVQFAVSLTAGANGSVVPAGTAPALAAPGTRPMLAAAMALGAPVVELVDYGSAATYSIMPKLGYHIINVLADGVSVGPVYTYTFKDVKAAHGLSATFAPDVHVITPSVIGHGVITPGTPQSVSGSASRTFTFAAAAGYKLGDVIVNGVSVGAVPSYTLGGITADNTIVAKFVPIQKATVTIASSSTSPMVGATVRLSGTLRPTSLAGREVTVQVRKPGSTVWSTVWHGTTTKTGAYVCSATLAQKGLYLFRTTFAGVGAYGAATSPTLQLMARYPSFVDLRLLPSTPYVSPGTRMTFTGRLQPAVLKGGIVAIEAHLPGRTKWVTLWVGQVDSTGWYRWPCILPTRGDYAFRTVYLGNSSYLGATSAIRRQQVR